MQTTNIEWCKNPDGTKGKSWNPVRGLCPGVYSECAEYCYARKLYKRYGWDQTIRLDEAELNCWMPKNPSRIFVGSTYDLVFAHRREMPRFEDSGQQWILWILDKANTYNKHTFIFLTKSPYWYPLYRFPKNCWLGMTVYGASSYNREIELERFRDFKQMNVPNLKFISFEPLLRDALGDEDLKGINWIILGAQTKPNIQPKKEWVDKIIAKAKEADTKIFIKNNLNNKLTDYADWSQQIPEA